MPRTRQQSKSSGVSSAPRYFYSGRMARMSAPVVWPVIKGQRKPVQSSDEEDMMISNRN